MVEHLCITLYFGVILFSVMALSKLSGGKTIHEKSLLKLGVFFTLMVMAGAGTLYTEVNIGTPPILRRIFVSIVLLSLFAIKQTIQLFLASSKPKTAEYIGFMTVLFFLFQPSEKLAFSALLFSLTWFVVALLISFRTLKKIPQKNSSALLQFVGTAVALSLLDILLFHRLFPRDYTLSLPLISILFTRFLLTLKENNSYLIERLSRQEQRIAMLIKEGMSNKEIAAEIAISEHTVKNHIYNMFKKLGIQNRTMLFQFLTPDTSE